MEAQVQAERRAAPAASGKPVLLLLTTLEMSDCNIKSWHYLKSSIDEDHLYERELDFALLFCITLHPPNSPITFALTEAKK